MRPTAVAVLLLGLFAGIGLGGIRRKAATSDEPAHLAAGYSYLTTRDFRLNPEHPPLVKLLAGLLIAPLHPHLPIEDPSWDQAENGEFRFGAIFLYGYQFDVDWARLLDRARLGTLSLAILFAALFQRWAGAFAGAWAGVVALVFLLASPEFQGHAQLVTTDLPVTVFLLASAAAARRVRESGTWAAFVGLGAAAGLAMASKYSGVLAWPIAIAFLVPEAIARGRRRQAILGLTLAAAVALIVVTLAYLGSAGPLAWLDGLRRVNANHDPDYPQYFLGEFRRGRFWSYFVVAYVLKTPLGFLAAVALGLGAGLRHLPAADRRGLLLAAVIVFAAATLGAANIGVRYVLPATPFLAVIAASTLRSPRRWLRTATVTCALLTAGESLARIPDDLSFFNLAAGGPAAGPRWLDDSNIDWGQDLRRLGPWLLANPGLDPSLVYYWLRSAPPRAVLPADSVRIFRNAAPLDRIPASGTYIVSAQQLVRLADPRLARPAPDWLALEPSERLGGLWIYRFGEDSAPGPAASP